MRFDQSVPLQVALWRNLTGAEATPRGRDHPKGRAAEPAAPLNRSEDAMQRMGMMVRLRGEHVAAYKEGHAAVWPSVLEQIGRSHIRNYSIFLREPENVLFAYFEYHGSDFAADMQHMADDPETQRWWDLMKPMQDPLETRAPGEWWAMMDEVFYLA